MFQTKVVEKIKRQILCSIFLFPENRAVYETMWNNTAERGRPQIIVWRMRIVCWIPKATNTHTHTIYNTYCFPLQQWLHKRASLLHYAYVACIVAGTGRH